MVSVRSREIKFLSKQARPILLFEARTPHDCGRIALIHKSFVGITAPRFHPQILISPRVYPEWADWDTGGAIPRSKPSTDSSSSTFERRTRRLIRMGYNSRHRNSLRAKNILTESFEAV
jgi:hypothetical protein